MPYEVQMLTSHQTWKNACAYDEGDGVQDETFATHHDARTALDELLSDIADDIAAGFSPPWNDGDFRIEYIPETTRELNRIQQGETP